MATMTDANTARDKRAHRTSGDEIPDHATGLSILRFELPNAFSPGIVAERAESAARPPRYGLRHGPDLDSPVQNGGLCSLFVL